MLKCSIPSGFVFYTTFIMIIGREKEQSELLGLLEKEESQFCAVYFKLYIFFKINIQNLKYG